MTDAHRPSEGRRESERGETVRRSLSNLPGPPIRPAFRDRLRAEFILGAVPGRRLLGTHVVRVSNWKWAASAAAIAALLLVIAVQGNRGPEWELSGVSGEGTAEIDGRPTPLAAPESVARRLHSGAEVVLPAGAQVELRLPGIAAIQIVGGSRAFLPGSPGRWFGRAMAARLEAGELRITTGPAFSGNRLVVVTPEVQAIVTGTTLAVLRQPDASCVCVLEGQVAMLGKASADTVRAGFRRTVYRDGRAPLVEPILPMETMKLTMLREQAGQALRR